LKNKLCPTLFAAAYADPTNFTAYHYCNPFTGFAGKCQSLKLFHFFFLDLGFPLGPGLQAQPKNGPSGEDNW
jgi:hypothetical protein